jgi:hypothetical protein
MFKVIHSILKPLYVSTLRLVWTMEASSYMGTAFSCPICLGSFRAMKPFQGVFFIREKPIDHYTKNALCPRCRSDIRHRFAFRFLMEHSCLAPDKIKLLHFAPEICLSVRFRKVPSIEYVPCDLRPERFPGSVAADITDIPFDEAVFDGILSIHVLEHIPDEAKALSELFRVLKPGGWALIAVPIYGKSTFEASGLDAAGRLRMYGAEDHLRMNGLDIVGRMRQTGFNVQTVSFDNIPKNYINKTINTPHTKSDRYLFFCRKPPQN